MRSRWLLDTSSVVMKYISGDCEMYGDKTVVPPRIELGSNL